MELYTQDLLLRTASPKDSGEVARIWDPDRELSQEEALAAICGMEENHRKNAPGRIYHLCLAVTKRDDPDSFIGWCGLDGTSGEELHIFYSIVPQRQGQGYATQAAKALLRYAFKDAGVPFVNGGCYKDNLASYQVMEKAGMRRAGENENGDPLFYIDRETYLDDSKITGTARL